MEATLVAGVTLIVMGVAVLGYDQYSNTTNNQVLQIGPIPASTEQMHRFSLPPLRGRLLFGGVGHSSLRHCRAWPDRLDPIVAKRTE